MAVGRWSAHSTGILSATTASSGGTERKGLNFDVVLMGDMETYNCRAIPRRKLLTTLTAAETTVYTVTIGAGGRFKFYSSSNDETDVDNIIWFDQPGTFQRVRMEVSRRV